MAVDNAVVAKGKMVIKNIGLLLSGDIDRPILDADTVVAVEGVITAVGKQKDVDISRPDTLIDAKWVTLCPGLIDSHVHPVFGDWTPRQNQLGWIDSTLNGGVTTMISAGEVHLPGLRASLDRAQAYFAEQRDAGFGQLLEIGFHHPGLNYGGACQHLDATGAKVEERALGSDGQGLQSHDVLRPARQVHLSRRDHRGHAAVQGGVDPAELVLARRPVAEHRVHVAVDQPRTQRHALCIDLRVGVRCVHILLLAHRGDDAVDSDDGIGIQDRSVDIAR